MQEDGAMSSTDVAQQFSDATEVGKTSKESVSVEQRQLLRAAEPFQCVLEVKAKAVRETSTQRQGDFLELTHSLPASWYSASVYGKDADELYRRRQGSELEDASFDCADIAAETEMANKRLRFKVLVNHNNGSVAAMARPTDVTEHMVRVVCDRSEIWGFEVFSLKCQNETQTDLRGNVTVIQ